MELVFQYPMPQQFSFVGQRADKLSVNGIVDPEDADVEDDSAVIRTGGVVKKVEHYTITCDECGEIGRYDEKGDIICQDCGMVLSGGGQAQLPVDYSGSRGYAEEDGDHPMGIVEPSV